MPNQTQIEPDPAADLLLTEAPLDVAPPDGDPRHGACVQFLGVVRDLEAEEKISGIDYKAYPPMAQSKLAQLAKDGAEQFEPHTLKLHHRLGFVPAAEPSVIICVSTPHSQAAFDICQFYLKRLKTELPIWKEIRFP